MLVNEDSQRTHDRIILQFVKIIKLYGEELIVRNFTRGVLDSRVQ